MTSLPTTLGEHIDFANGKSSPDRTERGAYPVFGSNGIIGLADVSNSPSGTTVIGRVGSYCGSLHYSKGPCWVTDNAIKATAKQSDEARFWYFALQTLGLHNLRSGSGQPLINQTSLKSVPLLAPPREYRLKVAGFLGSLDDKIELNRRMNETLEAMAQAIFRDWFVDFGPTRRKLAGITDPVEIMGGLTTDQVRAAELAPLFPAAFDDDGLPDGWESATVGELFDVNPNEPLKRGLVAPYTDMASLPVSGCTADTPIKREFGSGMRFRNGDALLARITPCLENGKAAYVDFLPKDEPVGWGSTEFIVFRARPPIPTPLAYLLVRHPEFRALAIQSMTGTSGRQRAQSESLARFDLCKAPAEVFSACGEFVVPFFAMIRSAAAQNQTLAATRDLLLPKLMAGEIRLRDAEAIVEGAT